MRLLSRKEKKKRGCEYCEYQVKQKGKVITAKGHYYRKSHYCMFEECPFHELDKYETYDDYLKSPDCKLNLKKVCD